MAGGRTELEVVKDIFFNKFVDLKNHVLNCHAKLIPCPYGKCDKKFGLSNKLSRHVEKKHPRNNVVMMDKEQARRQDWLNAQKKTQTTELALFTDICKSGNMVTLNRLVVNMSNDRNVSSDSATVTELESRADGGPSSISRLVAEEARLVIPTSYITPPQTISSIEKERAVRHIGTRDNLQTMPSLINVTVRPQDLPIGSIHWCK
ncbi:hypothetical protein BDD12DRAFT_346562 [Trichophaea hybrida]|nr:hypothetical protein BDD12DRAFT_346562 [Trichophaea hybrida]